VTADKNGVIKFTDVRLADGIHSTNSGIFTCENPGLYLIFVYIVTNTNQGSYYVYKNTDAIADEFASLTDYYQTASTTVNDTISVKGSLFVYKNYESCLQIQ
jgi:hypothetical protein